MPARPIWLAGAIRCHLILSLAGPGAALAQEAQRQTTAPLPPARPFDLQAPGSSGPVQPSLPATQGGDGTQAPAPAQSDPPPRAAPGTPQPPRRPDTAPLSNPADEEEEPEGWPRRTPGQRGLQFEPRIEPPATVPINGITTDPGTTIGCLPPPLRTVLNAIVERYGSVHVTSTFRPAWRARRNSYHRRCEAVDMRVPGHSPRDVLQFVKTLPETGGHKVYWNGLVHVDVGPWRTW